VILDEIVQHKRRELAEAARRLPLDEVRSRAAAAEPARDFRGALAAGPAVALIAEIKRASPSAGVIREAFDPAGIARDYAAGGAAALSVLTDERYFRGRLDHVGQAKAAVSLPVLRKDFVLDPYQLHEARAAGADAVLLIVRILADEELRALLGLARELGMAALVETHDAADLERAVRAGADLVGINNRNLDTLTVDLGTTCALAREVPEDRLIVSESGIRTREDVERVAACGVGAVLVGETLMRSPDPAAAARELAGVPRGAGR